MKLLILLIICITTTVLIKAELRATTLNGDNTVETPYEDQEVIVTTALFSKINWIITDIQQIKQNVEEINKRLKHQENLLGTSMRNGRTFEANLREAIETQTLSFKKMLLETQNEISQRLVNIPQPQLQPQRQPQPPPIPSLAKQSYITEKTYGLAELRARPNWTVILRRQDGSENFNRLWSDYRQGFGDRNGEFFIGLENLYNLTSLATQELLVVMEDYENKTRYAHYNRFAVANETHQYRLTTLGFYQGDAGNALWMQKHTKFSTRDNDRDLSDDNCALIFEGGWWFTGCHYRCFLTGPYKIQASPADAITSGIIWESDQRVKYSLKFVEMMIRPTEL